MPVPASRRRHTRPRLLFAAAAFALLSGALATLGLSQISTSRPATTSVVLSDLDLTLMDQQWGTPGHDRSVSDTPLRIAGREFARGIGTHANSRLVVQLNGGAQRFQAFVGVDDDESGMRSSVRFSVRGDGKELWNSGIVKRGDPAVPIDLDVSAVQCLSLHVDDGGNGNAEDHADWAEPVLSGVTRTPTVIAHLPEEAGYILSGQRWTDDRGQHIQAHGGSIVSYGGTYYWFGEDRSKDNEKGKCFVACYSSTDLTQWTFRRQVVARGSPFPKAPEKWWTLERPKVFYNQRTGKFVMYVHIEGGELRDYWRGEVAIFTSDSVDGNYEFVRNFRPLGKESRDIGQFIDDDGTAYLIFESRPSKGFYIARLTDDYMDVEKITCFIKSPLEGGALVKYDGLYYIIGSWMTGWAPNNNMYATARSLTGPWSSFRNIAPEEADTYGSQSTSILKIVGTNTTSVIFMGDMWKPKTQWDSRYLWMPLEIGNGKLRLPEPRPWKIDAKSGVVSY